MKILNYSPPDFTLDSMSVKIRPSNSIFLGYELGITRLHRQFFEDTYFIHGDFSDFGLFLLIRRGYGSKK